jgi:hypothetical protein
MNKSFNSNELTLWRLRKNSFKSLIQRRTRHLKYFWIPYGLLAKGTDLPRKIFALSN